MLDVLRKEEMIVLMVLAVSSQWFYQQSKSERRRKRKNIQDGQPASHSFGQCNIELVLFEMRHGCGHIKYGGQIRGKHFRQSLHSASFYG